MSRNDERKAEAERIRASTDDLQMTFRWGSTIATLFLLTVIIYGLVTGQIRSWRSSGVLLSGIFMASQAIWGWRVYYRRKKQKP